MVLDMILNKKERLVFMGWFGLISFLSGALGAFVVFYFLLRTTADFPPQGIVIEKRENVTIVSDERWRALIPELSPSIVVLIRPPKGDDLIIKESDFLGYGVFVTNDGWIAVPSRIVSEFKPSILTIAKEVHSVDKIVKQKGSELSLMKIAPSGFRSGSLSSLDSIRIGDQVGLISFDSDISGRFKAGLIQGFSLKSDSPVLSSEKVYRYPDANLSGTGVLADLDGDFIGFVIKDEILPFYALKMNLSSLLLSDKSSNPFLGIEYAPLGGLIKRKNKAVGAEVKVVRPDSPAWKAGFKPGDIVIKVDNDEVKQGDDLSQLIMDYRPGQKVKFEVFRKGERISLEAKLGSVQ